MEAARPAAVQSGKPSIQVVILFAGEAPYPFGVKPAPASEVLYFRRVRRSLRTEKNAAAVYTAAFVTP